jgi:predicted transcriptional regulator
MKYVEKLIEYSDDLGYLISSNISRRILFLLEIGPETPTRISRVLKMSLSNVSTKLKELKIRGLVECINPGRRKGRIYIITTKGKSLLYIMQSSYNTTLNLKYEDKI